MRRTPRILLAILWTLSAASCGGEPPPPPPAKAPAPAAPPALPPPPGPAEKPAPEQAKVPVELGDKDFLEGPSNRDPFRSFLAEFSRPARRVAKLQRRVILPRYGLDELRLIAVVTGGARAHAMFRDPKGLGVSVKRGDYISKNAAKIKQILADQVVVEIEEQSEDKSAIVDRVIDLHPKVERETEENP
jgi:type IV pilus assembly protein PilP